MKKSLTVVLSAIALIASIEFSLSSVIEPNRNLELFSKNVSIPQVVESVQVGNSSEKSHELIDGYCAWALDRDMIYYNKEDKSGILLTVRTSEFHVDAVNKTIYCIKVLNEDKSNSTAGYVYISNGGVSYSEVTIELESQRGEGFTFDIFVYAH